MSGEGGILGTSQAWPSSCVWASVDVRLRLAATPTALGILMRWWGEARRVTPTGTEARGCGAGRPLLWTDGWPPGSDDRPQLGQQAGRRAAGGEGHEGCTTPWAWGWQTRRG